MIQQSDLSDKPERPRTDREADKIAPPLPPPRDLAAELVDRGDGWYVSPDRAARPPEA